MAWGGGAGGGVGVGVGGWLLFFYRKAIHRTGPLKHLDGRGEFPLFSPVPASSARRRCLSAAPDNNSGLTSVRRVPFVDCILCGPVFVGFSLSAVQPQEFQSENSKEAVTYWAVSAANQIELFLSPSSLALCNTLCESIESLARFYLTTLMPTFHLIQFFR